MTQLSILITKNFVAALARYRERDTDAYAYMCLDAPLSRRPVICMPKTGYTTGANNCIIRWRVDNDRRVSGRILRVNSDGFTIAGALPYLAFWPVALKTTVGSTDSCTKCQT